jgi:uncharacterized protein (DUF2235 family)
MDRTDASPAPVAPFRKLRHHWTLVADILPFSEAAMAKNIVICCDGTGNQVEGNLSNVLKLFRVLYKKDSQRIYYNPGIGTIGTNNPWTRLSQNTKRGVRARKRVWPRRRDTRCLPFCRENYQNDDRVFLFGFSRGAYTIRALAGFIHMIGLLPPDQLNIANYALSAYKSVSERQDFQIAWQFGHVTGARPISIDFIGVWDTVASMIVPRWDRGVPIPTLQTLPYTRRKSSVKVFRHAKALDERRRMFRLNRWTEPQCFIANPFEKMGQRSSKISNRSGSRASMPTSVMAIRKKRAVCQNFRSTG